ncbi:hypothetical protein LXL04_021481 [Taraxacum kok-saghyz]
MSSSKGEFVYPLTPEKAIAICRLKACMSSLKGELVYPLSPEKAIAIFRLEACMSSLNGELGYQPSPEKAIGEAYLTSNVILWRDTRVSYIETCVCRMATHAFIQAEADCTKAIDLDKKGLLVNSMEKFEKYMFIVLKNVKAYVRRGTAREMHGYYKKAIEDILDIADFRYALVLETTNKRAAMSADRLKKLFQ